jgi:sortase A
MNAAADRGGSSGPAPGIADAGVAARACGSGPQRAGSSPIGGALRWLALGFAATGLWLAGDGLAIHAKAALAQVLLQQAWQITQATGAALRPWPGADTRPIARLSLGGDRPDLFVLAGASGRTLAFGPGHHDGSALPGTVGNAVLSAHRDTHFRSLRDLAVGDAVSIERSDGALVVYRVRQAKVVDRSDLVLPRDPGLPMLTLITCWPFDAVAAGTPLRYVVVATAE